MKENDYQYALEIYRQDGSKVGLAAVAVDWEPAKEWTRLLGLRRGALGTGQLGEAASIRPLWDPTAGEPYLRGFRVSIASNGAREVSEDFSTVYFRGLARGLSSHFVEKGTLQEDETIQYLALAFPRRAPAEAKAEPRFSAEETEPALFIRDSVLADFTARATPAGVIEAEDLPVFIREPILEEAADLVGVAGGRETGGVLIGHLHRDASLPELFVEVTAQIPGDYTEGTATRLTFTAATWTAARAAVDLRGKQEIFLGYWHSHPVHEWCKQKTCTPEKQRGCTVAQGFFSTDDQAFLRTAFPRAHSLGLLVTVPPLGKLSFSLFGWRQGAVAARGYYVMGGDHAP